jgi:hypothetical protein
VAGRSDFDPLLEVGGLRVRSTPLWMTTTTASADRIAATPEEKSCTQLTVSEAFYDGAAWPGCWAASSSFSP